jgi:hypothetical protein
MAWGWMALISVPNGKMAIDAAAALAMPVAGRAVDST